MPGPANTLRGRLLEALGRDSDSALPPLPAELAIWDRKIKPMIPAAPRPLRASRPPIPIMLGATLAAIVMPIAISQQWNGVQWDVFWANLPALLVMLGTPAAIWGYKLRRERRILASGEPCLGMVAATHYAYKSSRVEFVYWNSAGASFRTSKTDWWIRQKPGRFVYVFVDSTNPRRSVVQGCCAFSVIGLENSIQVPAPA
ncbi:MAG TPA: hypothetical protein VIE13_12465 [Terriglobales bacterium]|jgi:hypothetical protein